MEMLIKRSTSIETNTFLLSIFLLVLFFHFFFKFISEMLNSESRSAFKLT